MSQAIFNPFLDGLAQGALQGAQLEIQSQLYPPLVIDLTPGGEGSRFMQLLKPTFIVRKGGAELFRASPAGVGDPEAWKVTLAVSVAVVVGVLLLSLMLTRK